jgi:hypothetical protein
MRERLRPQRTTNHRRWLLQPEALEPRRLLTVQFVQQPALIESDLAGARAVVMADLDGDGDLDLLAGSAYDGRLGWFENLDGQGTFGSFRQFADDEPSVAAVRAVDLDGDGDLDVVSISSAENRIRWYPNTDGRGNFGAPRLVTEAAILGESVEAADLDGDGDLDLISTSGGPYDSDVSWYENLDGRGTFGPQQLVTADVRFAYAAIAVDIDGDGDADLVSAAYVDEEIAWYENTDGSGSFGPKQVIGTVLGANEVIAADLDGDGYPDLVAGGFYTPGQVVWFRNLEGTGNFSDPITLASQLESVETIQAVDFDQDGDLDLVTQSVYGEEVLLIENLDGAGTFDQPRIVASGFGFIAAAVGGDLNGDGLPDIAFASVSSDRIGWTANLGDSFGPVQIVSRLGAVGVNSAVALDIDQDGDLDVAVASVLDNRVLWFENLDGRGSFGPEQTIDANLVSAIHLEVADVNADGRDDLVVAAASGTLAWYEQLADGTGFSPRQVITADLFSVENARAADLDGDGDLDIVAAARYASLGQVVWFENLDGEGTFGPPRIVNDSLSSAREVVAVDLDGDGDLDLAVVSMFDNRVVWFENEDGQGTFGPERIVSTESLTPTTIAAADLDGDGDADLVVTSFYANRVQWFENLDGAGSFSEIREIGVAPAGPEAMTLADIDGDGDLDVFVTAVAGDVLVWYEHIDGQGQFAEAVAIDDQLPGASDVTAADLDGDGRLDLIATAYDLSRVIWYRNLPSDLPSGDLNQDGVTDAADIDLLCASLAANNTDSRFDLNNDGIADQQDYELLVRDILRTKPGDANLDGVFDSRDLVLVFAAGEYEDDELRNSGWASGDWNCDGEFNSSDLVAAFQAGGYIA